MPACIGCKRTDYVGLTTAGRAYEHNVNWIKLWDLSNKTHAQVVFTTHDTYEILNRYGNEKKAVEIAEKRLLGHKKSGLFKPSEMCPGTKLHHLVDEIKRKTEK